MPNLDHPELSLETALPTAHAVPNTGDITIDLSIYLQLHPEVKSNSISDTSLDLVLGEAVITETRITLWAPSVAVLLCLLFSDRWEEHHVGPINDCQPTFAVPSALQPSTHDFSKPGTYAP